MWHEPPPCTPPHRCAANRRYRPSQAAHNCLLCFVSVSWDVFVVVVVVVFVFIVCYCYCCGFCSSQSQTNKVREQYNRRNAKQQNLVRDGAMVLPLSPFSPHHAQPESMPASGFGLVQPAGSCALLCERCTARRKGARIRHVEARRGRPYRNWTWRTVRACPERQRAQRARALAPAPTQSFASFARWGDVGGLWRFFLFRFFFFFSVLFGFLDWSGCAIGSAIYCERRIAETRLFYCSFVLFCFDFASFD